MQGRVYARVSTLNNALQNLETSHGQLVGKTTPLIDGRAEINFCKLGMFWLLRRTKFRSSTIPSIWDSLV